ncbi:hypothetical protein ACIGW8_22405 [Streptomyces sioyaensis]|uniref:hypothetical protein n=1 Tax=Streptomyces sioyaensis TaxID=67364 RepID=UPI0037D352B7
MPLTGARWASDRLGGVRAEHIPQLAEQGARVRVRNLARTGGHGQARKKIAKAVPSRGAAADGLRSGR